MSAFGAAGRPERLPGGQGTSWRVGDLVLKPAEEDASETLVWLDQHARPALRDAGLRIALPVRGAGGVVVIDGWTATPWLEGVPPAGGWSSRADVGRQLARAFSGVDPRQLPARDDPWARAERAVWESPLDAPLRDHPLTELLRPVDAPLAVVHGDLAGNVLVDPRLPPAVIDLSLYARPVEWSVAVLAVDAVCFEGAPVELLRSISADPSFPQHLARGLLFRMTTDVLLGGLPGRAYERAVADVLALL